MTLRTTTYINKNSYTGQEPSTKISEFIIIEVRRINYFLSLDSSIY